MVLHLSTALWLPPPASTTAYPLVEGVSANMAHTNGIAKYLGGAETGFYRLYHRFSGEAVMSSRSARTRTLAVSTL